MRAGRLRSRVTIETPGSGKDEYGHPTRETWSEVATVWANVKPITGRERWANEHTIATASVAVTIRYQNGISSKMRVKIDGDYYEIKGPPVDPDHMKRELVLMCERYQS